MIKKLFISFLFLGVCSLGAQPLTIKYPLSSLNKDRDSYQIDLIKFLLTKANIPFKIENTEQVYTQARIIKELKVGKNINLYWMGTSPQIEEELTPIRFPIYRGLLGHRVFIINKSDQPLFNHVKSLKELQKFKGAQGIGWSDIAILEASGLEQHATKYENIFKMVNRGGRVSYFSRGLNEAFSEVETRQAKLKNITVEEKIVLVYPFAMFFFVAPQEKKLVKVLTKGFELAYKDGSLERFFYKHPKIKKSIEQSNLENRTRIEITNPFLTPQTAEIPKKFWHGKFTKIE